MDTNEVFISLDLFRTQVMSAQTFNKTEDFSLFISNWRCQHLLTLILVQHLLSLFSLSFCRIKLVNGFLKVMIC